MATYLYGLILARNAHLVPAHIAGIAGSTVRVVGCDALNALVSTLDRTPASASLDDVRAHDHALQAVVHHGPTVAATRFGQTFANDVEARRHVVERGERTAMLLEEFDGCVEMRLLMPSSEKMRVDRIGEVVEASRDDLGEGTAYLKGLSATAARSRDATARFGLRGALGLVVRAERVEELPKSRGVVFAHLVLRREESAYREAVIAMPALTEARVVGPLALYSFAEPAE